jgi:hypothetical protein
VNLGHLEIPTPRIDTAERAACAGPTQRAARRIDMTEPAVLTGVATILRKAVGEKTAIKPLINSQAVAGSGTADGAGSMPPAIPGVPISPAPKLSDASVNA